MKSLFLYLILVAFVGERFGQLQPSSCVKKVAIPRCLPPLANYLLQYQAKLIQKLTREVQAVKHKIQNVKKSLGQWPAGSYCILASGACPNGFTLKSGHLRALNMYSHTQQYIKPVNFGSSRIICHGRCGQYGRWVGDLFISACCK